MWTIWHRQAEVTLSEHPFQLVAESAAQHLKAMSYLIPQHEHFLKIPPVNMAKFSRLSEPISWVIPRESTIYWAQLCTLAHTSIYQNSTEEEYVFKTPLKNQMLHCICVRQCGPAVRAFEWGSRRPRLYFWLCQWPAAGPGARYLTFLYLNITPIVKEETGFPLWNTEIYGWKALGQS